MNDLIDQDLGDKNIEINNDSLANNTQKGSSDNRLSKASTSSNQSEQKNSGNTPKGGSLEQAITQRFTNKAKDQLYKSWIDRYLCCFNWLKKYFQINSKDFFNRIILSIIPFNSKFYELVENSPDFYGPFWIYTTLIVLISSCGSLTRTIQGNRDTNFFQEFIPTASILIYFIGFGVPIFLALFTKIFGGKLNIAPIICIYGYSYTIFLPITIVCSIPHELLQWVLLAYAIFSSTSLIIMSVSRSIASIQKGKKIAVIVIICIFQIIIFFVLKLYFFKHLNKELLKDENLDNLTNTTLTNTTLQNDTILNDSVSQNKTKNLIPINASILY